MEKEVVKKKEITAAILLFFIAVALFYYSAGFPVKNGGLRALNPGFYPKLLAVLLGFLSVVYLFQTLRKTVCADDTPSQKIWVSGKSLRLFLTTAAALVAYPFVLNFAGFATAGFLFLTLLIFALTDNPGRRIPRIVGVSFGLTVLMFVIFKVILRIPFPQGLLI